LSALYLGTERENRPGEAGVLRTAPSSTGPLSRLCSYGYHHLLVNVVVRLRRKGVDDAGCGACRWRTRRARSCSP